MMIDRPKMKMGKGMGMGTYASGLAQGTRTGGIGSQVSAEAKSRVPSYKKGGKVRKTGLALLHKGERVVKAKKKR